MDPFVLKELNKCRMDRVACMVVTNLGDGRDRLVREGDHVEGELGKALKKSFQTGKSTSLEMKNEAFFLNVHLPVTRIVLVGAVHISQALASIAKIAGYDLEVIDPRTAFATKERFEGVPLFAEWPEEVLASRRLDAYCALAAVTHDPKIDDFPLQEALRKDCFYVGALGSRKTHGKRMERFQQAGFLLNEIEKIHAPIGLDIAAANPQEIAVAIMAEIIHAFHNRGAGTGYIKRS